MKKLLAILLCLLTLLPLSLPACASEGAEETEFYLSPVEMQPVISAFPDEVEYFSLIHGIDLTDLTASEFDVVKRGAALELNNPEHRFSDFVTEISNVRAQQRIEREASRRWYSKQNVVDVSFRSYGPLEGEYIDAIASSTEVTEDSSFTFEIGKEIRGVTLGLGLSVGKSVSIMGPSPNDTLPNGYYVTHHIFMSVLFGTIRYTEYDLVTATGTTHVSYYYIDEASTDIIEYGLRAAITDRVYVKHAASNVVLGYNTLPHLKEAIVETPETLIYTSY